MLVQIFSSYFAFDFDTRNLDSSVFAELDAPFPAFVWLAWLLWLVCALFLLRVHLKATDGTTFDENKAENRPNVWREYLPLLISLAVVLVIAYAQRAAQLLPSSSGQLPASNYDEMVYFSGAGLWAQSYWPYRDFLLAHPPVTLLVFGAWLKIFGQATGGRDAFVLARQLSVFLGVLTTAGVYWVAARMWARTTSFNWLTGFAAALIYGLDVRASQVAVLETVSNCWAVFAFVAFVESSRRPASHKWRNALLAISGFLAAGAFLSKLPGLALFLALLVYLIWKNFRQWRDYGWLFGGFVVGGVALSGIFILKGGVGAFVRQVIFFQVLRPDELRAGIDEVVHIADYPESRLTILLALLTLFLLTYRFCQKRQQPQLQNDLWLIPLFWSVPLLAIYIFSKSFHPWYYVQWALPLALFGGGLFSFDWQSLKNRVGLLKILGLAVVLLLSVPFIFTEWAVGHSPVFDNTYQPVADYVHAQAANTTNAPKSMLVFDPGFAFMSGLQPAKLPDGKFLVDSAGYMTYLNENIDRTGLFGLLGQALSLNHQKGEVTAIFHANRAQALVSEAATANQWSVLDVKLGLAQLTPQTVEFLENTATQPPTMVGSSAVWLDRDSSAMREYSLSNNLQLFTPGLSLSQNGKANVATANNQDVLSLNPAQLPNSVLTVRLVWRVVQSPTQPGKLFVHLIDAHGQTVAQSDLAPLNGQADLRNWKAGDAYQDVHSLPLPSNLAVGEYTVQIGLYDPENGQRVSIEGQDSLTLGKVVIGTSR